MYSFFAITFFAALVLSNGVEQVKESEGILGTLVPHNMGIQYNKWFLANKDIPCGTAYFDPSFDVTLEAADGTPLGTAHFNYNHAACVMVASVCQDDQDVSVSPTCVQVCPTWSAIREVPGAVTFPEGLVVDGVAIQSGSLTIFQKFYLHICGEFSLSFGKGFKFQYPKTCLTSVQIFDYKIEQITTQESLISYGVDLCSGCFSKPAIAANCAPACLIVQQAIQTATLGIGQTFDDTMATAAFDATLPECQSHASLFPSAMMM